MSTGSEAGCWKTLGLLWRCVTYPFPGLYKLCSCCLYPSYHTSTSLNPIHIKIHQTPNYPPNLHTTHHDPHKPNIHHPSLPPQISMCVRSWLMRECGDTGSIDKPCAPKWKGNLNNCPKYSVEEVPAGKCETCLAKERKAEEKRVKAEAKRLARVTQRLHDCEL